MVSRIKMDRLSQENTKKKKKERNRLLNQTKKKKLSFTQQGKELQANLSRGESGEKNAKEP